jgi:hypothetical protein
MERLLLKDHLETHERLGQMGGPSPDTGQQACSDMVPLAVVTAPQHMLTRCLHGQTLTGHANMQVMTIQHQCRLCPAHLSTQHSPAWQGHVWHSNMQPQLLGASISCTTALSTFCCHRQLSLAITT